MSGFIRFVSAYFKNPTVRFNVSVLVGLLLNSSYIVFNLVYGIAHENVWNISVSAYYALIVSLRYMLIGISGEKTGQISTGTVGSLILILFLPMSGIMIYTVLTSASHANERATIIVFALYAAFGILRALYGIFLSDKKLTGTYRMAYMIRLSLALISLFNFQTSLLSMLSIKIEVAKTLNFITGGSVSVSMLALARMSGREDLS